LAVAIVVGIAVAAGAGSYLVRDPAPARPPAAAHAPSPAVAADTPPALPPAPPVKMTPPQEVAKAIVPAAPPMQMQAPMQMQPNPVPGLSTDERARQAREAAFSNPSALAQQRTPPPTVAAPGAAPVAATAPQAATAQPASTGLPADAPKIAITGGVYSPSPAQRMLIVNGQVFNEGSEVAPGLVVEKIEPRTAVLKFRGASYTVAY
jgi:general secretion pathway protein B